MIPFAIDATSSLRSQWIGQICALKSAAESHVGCQPEVLRVGHGRVGKASLPDIRCAFSSDASWDARCSCCLVLTVMVFLNCGVVDQSTTSWLSASWCASPDGSALTCFLMAGTLRARVARRRSAPGDPFVAAILLSRFPPSHRESRLHGGSLRLIPDIVYKLMQP